MIRIVPIALALAAAATLSACSSGPLTIRGTLENDSRYDPSAPDTSHTWVADSARRGRCLDDETIDVVTTVDGRSVVVARGHPRPGYWSPAAALGSPCIMDFTIRGVPGGHGSYGLRIEGVPGTANYTAGQLSKRGVSLSFGSG